MWRRALGYMHRLQDAVMLCRKQRPEGCSLSRRLILWSITTASLRRDGQVTGKEQIHSSLGLERFDCNQELLTMFIIDNAHKCRLLAVSHSFACVLGSELVPQFSGHPGCTRLIDQREQLLRQPCQDCLSC